MAGRLERHWARRGINKWRALALLMAGLALLGGGEAKAQTGIFRLFAPQQTPPAEQTETAQRFADAEEEVVAKGAPLSIRPPEENVKPPVALAFAPLPPRRPPEFPPRRAVADAPSAAQTDGADSKPEAPAKDLAGEKPEPKVATAEQAVPAPLASPRLVALPPANERPVEPPSAEQNYGNNPMLAFAPQTTGSLPAFGSTRGFADPQPRRQAALPAPLMRLEATPGEIEAEEEAAPEPVHVEKQTDYVNIACLDPHLMQLIQRAGAHFGGKPVITSGLRSNGRRGSYHRKCQAADFFVPGIDRAVLATWLRSQPDAGGVGTYCHTKSVHLDIGEARNWTQCGFRFRFALRGTPEKRG